MLAVQALYQRCKEVEPIVFGEYLDWKLQVLGWKVVESRSPNVKMSMKYFLPKKGERSVATGRASGMVDCEAAEVAAWLFDYCSRDRMRISQEEGHPARLIVEDKKVRNEIIFATVKKMPFLLTNREFVVRQIWMSDIDGITICAESTDAKVDYGASFKTVRASMRALYRIENLPDQGQIKQCRVTFYQYLDAGGSIPTWIVNSKMPEALGVVQDVINVFSQDDKVDSAQRDVLVKLMREGCEDQEYTEKELAVLDCAKNKLETLRTSDYEPLKSPDVFVKMDKVVKEGATIGIGRAITIVDTTLEECAAWEWVKITRERSKESKNLDRVVVKLNEHSQLFRYIRDFKIPGFKQRERLSREVWKREDNGDIVCAYENAEHNDFPIQSDKYIRVSATTMWRFEKLPARVGIPQTRVTYSFQADPKGLIPKRYLNFGIASRLISVSKLRKKFDKSLEIDKAKRKSLIPQIERIQVGREGSGRIEAQFNNLFKERVGSEEVKTGLKSARNKIKIEKSRSTIWGQTR